MKRKVFDLRPWDRVAESEQTVGRMPGHIVVEFRAVRVRRPLDLWSCGEQVRLLDDGYCWLRIHPHGAGEGVMGHALTIQLDAQGVPVQLYIDIHGGEGVTESGLPWHDDLYLDVLAAVDPLTWTVRAVEYIDQDELQAALGTGQVTPQQVRDSYAEAESVRSALLSGTFLPLQVGRAYLDRSGLSQT